MHSFAVILLGLLASDTSAATVTGSRFSQLARRQASPAVPSVSACSDSCTPIGQSIQACVQASVQAAQADPGNATAADSGADCGCTDDIASKYQACFSCAVAHGGDAAAAQTALQNLAQACKASNHPFNTPPSVTASSGGSSSATSASGASGSSATASSSSGGSSPNGASPLGVVHAVIVAIAISGAASILLSS